MSDLRTGKVGLVGTGMVGSSFAYALIQRGLASELVLVDLNHERAEGEAMDLNHGMSFLRPTRVYAGDYNDLAGADVVVLAAGANQGPGQTRLDLLKVNAAVFRDIVPRILAVNEHCIIVIATNPVDILTHISAELAGLEHGRVIGSGTILDTARFRVLLGEHYRVDPRSVHGYIIGEHGDSSLPTWSIADIGGVSLHDYIGPNGNAFDQAALDSIALQVQNAAYEIIKRKQATYYAIGLGLLAIIEAVVRDQHTVLSVSSPLSGQYNVRDISISLPTVVGRKGVEKVLTPRLSDAEVALFQRSAAILHKSYGQVR